GSGTLLRSPSGHTRFHPPRNDNIEKEYSCLPADSAIEDVFDERDGDGNRPPSSIPDAAREELNGEVNLHRSGTADHVFQGSNATWFGQMDGRVAEPVQFLEIFPVQKRTSGSADFQWRVVPFER